MSGKEKSRRSVYEDSMKMVTNIIKLSSFSIAKLTLGTASSPVAAKSIAPEVASSGSGYDSVMVTRIPGSRRSQEPRSSSKPISFVMQPNREDESSSYVIHPEKKSLIDDKASDYISKVRKKNRNSFDETSRHSLYVVPPPPPPPPPPPRAMK